MAWPDDYFLPARSIIDDTPVVDVGYYKIAALQFEGLRLMYNEKLAAVLPAATPMAVIADPLKRTDTFVAAFRSALTTLFQNYVNTDIYAAGDIEGAAYDATDIPWTSAANVLASFSGGVGGAFTREPSRNPFGRAASSGTLTNFPAYKEHVNEIYQCLQAMQYGIRRVTARAPDGGTVNWRGKYGSGSTKAAAEAAYAAYSYANFGLPQVAMDEFTGTSTYNLLSNPGTLYIDLSALSGATDAQVFIGSGGDNLESPPVTIDGAFHLYDTAPLGSAYTSAQIGADSQPAWVGTNGAHGWSVNDRVIIHPDWTYT